MIILGSLYLSWEHTDGVLWCFDDGNKMFILRTGDYLKIYDKDETIIWDGELNFQYIGTLVNGFFVNDIQRNVNHKIWFNFFFNQNKSILIRKDV